MGVDIYLLAYSNHNRIFMVHAYYAFLHSLFSLLLSPRYGLSKKLCFLLLFMLFLVLYMLDVCFSKRMLFYLLCSFYPNMLIFMPAERARPYHQRKHERQRGRYPSGSGVATTTYDVRASTVISRRLGSLETGRGRQTTRSVGWCRTGKGRGGDAHGLRAA